MLPLALALSLPAAQAADLRIGAVVLKSARVTVQGPQRVVVHPGAARAAAEDIRVSVEPAGGDHRRIVLTP